MAEQRDFIGLDWVKGEVKATLAETRRELEQFTKSSGGSLNGSSHLISCRKQLQQVHSMMKMLEQHGARLLTGEMLELLINMEKTPSAQLGDHIVVLMQGMLLLPNYLEQVSRSGRERPEQFKPLLRQMRDLRKQPPLGELDFFIPDITNPQDPLLPDQLDALRQKNFTAHVKKMRHGYQTCLAGLLRSQKPDKQLTIINKVFGRLQNLCWGAPATLLWDAALALGAALKDGDISLNPDTILLLREMDHQMKMLVISDVDGVNDAPDEALLRKLFYHIAKAETANPLVTSLKFRYRLDEALQAAQAEASEAVVSVETAEATARALSEELQQIKQKLQHLSAQIQIKPAQLQELQQSVSQLAGTMALLGFAPQNQQLLGMAQQLQSVINGQSPATETLQNIRRQLIQTEHAIHEFAQQQQVLNHYQQNDDAPEHIRSIISAREKLDKVKQAIVDYLANQGQINLLQAVPTLMADVHGQLTSIALNRAADQVSLCGKHIQQNWLEKHQQPSLEELDALTDLIAAIDYSLEQHARGSLNDNAAADAEGILDVADTSLAALRELVSKPSKPVVPEPESVADTTAETNVIRESVAPAPAISAEESRSLLPPPEETALDFLDVTEIQKATAPTASALENKQTADDEIIQCFIEETEEQQKILTSTFNFWKKQTDHQESLITIRRGFHTLKGSGRMVGANIIGELAWSIENMLNRLLDGDIQVSDQMLELLDEVIQTLPELVTDFARDNQQFTPEVLVFMEKADALFKGGLFVTDEDDEFGGDEESEIIQQENFISEAEQITETFEEEPQQNILQLFLEEGFELIESSARAMEQWLRDTSNLKPVNELQRFLHTLKGGARMAELPELDELCHSLEDIYSSITQGKCEPGEAPLALIEHAHDTIESMLRALASGRPIYPRPTLNEHLKQWQPPRNKALKEVQDEPEAQVLPDYLGQKTLPPQTNIEPAQPAEPLPSLTGQSQSGEMIRIPLELLENLINLTGEASISRSRIEQQVSDASKLLDEVSTTVTRIREQVRRLDTENQKQIQALTRSEMSDFLDLNASGTDRTSELSQLSSSLIESASDLLDLRDVLQENNLEAEKILRQQSRTQIELQEQLMQARMVSFGRLVPRLRQIVRLVSSELGKPVELIVTNAEGEMDRTMLEHILAPLEHMLRNAISHGIEDDVKERLAHNKPAQGQIEITIDRDGGDIVIELIDDGRGIDPQLIRQQAIAQDFIPADARLSDQEIMHLILKSGFSTANQLTHISGRGVGLDVVNSEVRQLGGSITMNSQLGRGTRFSLRLPFTQSVNRALMVEVGSSLYALPMPSIDGIAMISPEVMRDCYEHDNPLRYDGVDHKVIFLGQLLDNEKPKRMGKQCPVVLIQRGHDCLALHVDTIIGSREMITKSLGVQFADLTGVNGATILGDGRVVVIVDPMALYRRQQKQAIQPQPIKPAKTNRAIRVLVIDDSVTVRKVASRLLTREGYEVDAAKDGIEAMAKLAEDKPDIVLLDIEMPNIDGFEVANSIRNDPQLHGIPIIMITSRTGEKHRNRALSIGVNEYIGKPFQEGPLLDAIQRLTAAV